MATLLVNELFLPSVDDVSSALEGSTWNADFKQLDRGRQQSRIKFVGSSQSSLLRFELGNRARQLAEPGRGTLNFGIPTRTQASGRFGRRILESETLTCFDPSSGFEVISEPGFSAYVLTFPFNRLSELAEMLELPDLPGSDQMLGTQRYPSAECLSYLRGELRAFFALSGHPAEAVRRNACEWGFWHLSKFSADYQRVFGELPSATRLAAAA